MRKVWGQPGRKASIQVPSLGQGPGAPQSHPAGANPPTSQLFRFHSFSPLSCVPLSLPHVSSLDSTERARGNGGCESNDGTRSQNRTIRTEESHLPPTGVPCHTSSFRLWHSWEPPLPERLKTGPGAVAGGDWIPALREIKGLTLSVSSGSV